MSEQTEELFQMRFGALSRPVSLAWCAVVYVTALTVAIGVGRMVPEPWGMIGVAAVADVVATMVVFAGSLLFDNSSLYDPYWSVAPPALGIFWIWSQTTSVGWPAVITLCLVTIWSVRLTANWVIRWQGMGHEDWRYAQYRERPQYWLISLIGFHLMPTLVVFAGCLPLVCIIRSVRPAYPFLFTAALMLGIGAVILEGVADYQLARFKRTAPPGKLLRQGVWALSRHPNYLGEMLFWWSLALAGVASSPRAWWTVIGAISITVLFVTVSIPLMERRLAGRSV